MNVAILFDALTIGAVYALVALGFTIVFAPTRVLNFAQGEFVILGAAGAFQLTAVWDWNPLLMILGAAAAAAVMGLLLERMVMLPVRLSGSSYAWIIATLSAALIFQAVFGLAFPSALLQPQPLVAGGIELGGESFEYQSLIVIVGALLIMGGFDQFMKRSIHGRAMRAAAHDPDTASLMGIGVREVVILSFVISGVVTGLAGVLAAPTVFIEPGQGLVYTIKGFTGAVIGGLGSAKGALIGGVIVGVLDTVVRNAVSPGFGTMVVVAALAAILLVFPSGFFGKPIEAH